MLSLKNLTLALLFCTAVSLWAETGDATNVAAQRRIVVLGDSITAGFGLDPEEAYPALLQEKLDAARLAFAVANAGVSGDTTAGGMRRIDWVLDGGADVLIVALGGNDGLRGIPPKQMEENLLAIVQHARAKCPGIAIFIAGMQMPSNLGADYVRQFAAVFPRVASTSHSTLIPYLLDGVGGVPALNQIDRIHPSAEGQKRVAENVWKGIKPAIDKLPAARK